MKINRHMRAIILTLLLVTLIPITAINARATAPLPPADLVFQLPWDQGVAWVAVDGLDYGARRPANSPHNYVNGGAVDFAPREEMYVGENTSNFWVTAAAAGTIIEKSACQVKIDHLNGWVTEYQFLGNIQVNLGQAVSRNQRLGIIADGIRYPFCAPAREPDMPHLHFTLRPNMRGATFAGWTIKYDSWFNITRFTKNNKTVGLYRPLMNTFDSAQIVLREPLQWDTVYTGTVDTYRYERWPFTLAENTNFTVTATATTVGLIPDVILLDSLGNELTRAAGVINSTQAAGNYFVQIQPQIGNGFYNIVLHNNGVPTPTGPYASVVVAPNIQAGETVMGSVNLNNLPAEGYTSAEFTCTYDANLITVSNIMATDHFGSDPATAINGPANGTFIVAIAGSHGNKATTSGPAFTFDVTALQAGQTQIACETRVSSGNNTLTEIPTIPGSVTINAAIPTPTTTPAPTETVPPTPPVNDWLTFTNAKYGFQFKYPADAQILESDSETYVRINLPFTPGTNLDGKSLEIVVAENASTCQSPLAEGWMVPPPSETVIINGLTFLKQTGEEGSAGHTEKWTAYSIARDNVCVSLDFVLRAANPGVFTTPPPLFDEAQETSIFGQIVATYAWLTLPPTPTPTPPSALPVITGQILASKIATVRLYDTNDNTAAIVNANPDGTFRIDAPAAGTYTIVATANGFMRLQGSITVANGDVRFLAPISLLAGDIDDNGVIDQWDAMTIGFAYNNAEPPGADLNSDGIINVLDLELLAANYRKVGPIAWQP